MKEQQIVDLSLPIRSGGPFRRPAQIVYINHQARALELQKNFDIEPSDLIKGKHLSFEHFTYLNAHTATHLDAPWHYTDTSEGKRARTIDEIPLEWCFSDGVVLDFSWKKPGEGITDKEIQQALKKTGYTLKPFDIPLVRTDASHHYGKPNCESSHPGMTREATLWLADQGIRVAGIDAWMWDRPFEVMLAELRQGKKDKFFEAHRAAGERGICLIEWLTNLDLLPPYGFKVCVFPIKIEGGSGGWVRAIALLPLTTQ